MKYQLLFIDSGLCDPFENLALENQLLAEIKPEQKILLMYANSPCVVMGRFQNPWLECNLAAIKVDRLPLVRRQSGGGCVYHDLGNLNFSFLHGGREFNKESNNAIIYKALAKFGIEVYASGRSDLLVNIDGEKKISGSAFKQKKDRSFHHGTLLVNSNLEKLNHYLKSREMNIENSKSIKSNPARVINLSQVNPEINFETLKKSMFENFANYYDGEVTYKKIEVFKEDNYFELIKDWQWRVGETPFFEIKFNGINCRFKKGIIDSIEDEQLNLIYQGIRLQPQFLAKVRTQNLDQNFHQFLNELALD